MSAPPETLLLQRCKAIFDAEFALEGWKLIYDKLLRAEGKDGTKAAVYPEDAVEASGQAQELVVRATIQLYLRYDPGPVEGVVIDPNIIVAYGDRLRRAFKTQSGGTTDDLWFLRLTGIIYPDDPTHNKTRLEATVQGFATNAALSAGGP